ncbi:hypothetical protein OTU49_002220 [Cherax quadricarinatus]|uniref:Transmembrane protein 186 n=2 Tax=Cherax quadricarinatus TaxID=27406 RepID=A0AAW0XNB5_CHEQU|nr:transmembrane protein 186-like isoform X2 [Cherax quadricarinatus]XP_053637737.1 transmembrane protein 186-like isoform X2 [Cherax quadricarinatus]XP_053637738.1 transmembrane protein 186-like isoform X2 [Cherax quadricarinatus]XP_053637740.1 transmembrane protein 186-like isoform X2 [Cherax quadricarinatus]
MLSTALSQQVYRRGIPLVAFLRCNTNVVRPLCSATRQHQCKESQIITTSKPLQNGNSFQMIYKFPHIRLARSLCRLKIHQTALTCLALPAAGYFAYVGLLGLERFVGVAAINGLALVMLYVMGEIFRRIVGHVYYDTQSSLAKVSHLNFWGSRKDIYIPSSDIVPIADTSDNPADIYVRLLRYSQPKFSLFLFLRFGGIIDHEKFSIVFGSLKPEQ